MVGSWWMKNVYPTYAEHLTKSAASGTEVYKQWVAGYQNMYKQWAEGSQKMYQQSTEQYQKWLASLPKFDITKIPFYHPLAPAASAASKPTTGSVEAHTSSEAVATKTTKVESTTK